MNFDSPSRSSVDAPPRYSADSPPRSSTEAGATSSGSNAPKRHPRHPVVRRIGKRVVSLPAGTKFTVSFNYAHRLVGEYTPDYVTHQGIVVRNMHITSLAYKSWHNVPHEMKQKMMDVVLKKFEIGDVAERLDLLKKSLGKKWKDFRAELKYTYWKGGESDEVMLKNIPPGVSEADWTWLLHYWGQEDVQEMCRKNKEHRSVQQMHHRTRRKSFAVIAHKEARSSGPPPSRLKMFELAYGKADLLYKEGFTRQKADAIDALLAAREQGLNSLTDDEIFRQVFGEERPGRVRCRGPGHTPTTLWGRRSSHVESERDREERRKQNEEITLRLDMVVAHQAQFEARMEEERQRDMRQIEEDFQERIRQMQAAHDEQMRSMMDEFSRRMMQPPPSL